MGFVGKNIQYHEIKSSQHDDISSYVESTRDNRIYKKKVEKRKTKSGVRAIRFLSMVLLVAALIILINLYKIQINDYDKFVSAGANQQFIMQKSQSRRGEIFDSEGILIASSYVKYVIGVTPANVRSVKNKVSKEEIADFTAKVLDLPKEKIAAWLEQKDKSYIQIAKNVEEEDAELLRSWLTENRVGGYTFDMVSERMYNNGDLAGQIVGFTRFEDQKLKGVLGLEAYYDSILNGHEGYSYARRDNYRNHGTVPFSIPTDQTAVDGSDMHLHLNLKIQEILQHELEQVAGVAGLSSGVSGLVMNVNTGAILAMGQIPTMQSKDPTATPGRIDPIFWNPELDKVIDQLSSKVWRNAVVSDVFEPGSTMKALTAAIVLEEDVVDENTRFDDSPLQVQSHYIHCVSREGHGVETMSQAFIRSCNPVFVQVGQRVDLELFYDYIRTFGLRNKTGIDLPAETNTIFHEKPSTLDFANLTFGESVAVTPLHMARAFAALVNGGYLVTPSVVKEFVTSDGVVETVQQDKPVQIISQETSDRVRELLISSGNSSTLSSFGCEGYNIAGKTSTSTDEVDKQNTYSFIAIGPSDSCDILCMIVVKKPVIKMPSSVVVTRHVKRLLGKVMDQMGYERNYSPEVAEKLERNVLLPDISGLTFSEAASVLSSKDLYGFRSDPDLSYDAKVDYLNITTATEVAAGSTVWLTDSKDSELVNVPDFLDLDYHDCIWLAESAGVVVRTHGKPTGTVVAQSPVPTRIHSQTEEKDEVGAPNADTVVTDKDQGKLPKGSVIDIWFEKPAE